MEVWKDIEGYEGYYQVSNLGRVKSLARNTSEKGKNANNKKDTILKGSLTKGYLQVDFRKDGKRKMFRIHRLVSECFIPNPDNKPYINHIDGNKSNNTVDNLEWCTPKENVKHAMDNNLIIFKNNSGPSKGVDKFSLDGKYLESYPSQAEAVRMNNFNCNKISYVCNGSKKQFGGFMWRHSKDIGEIKHDIEPLHYDKKYLYPGVHWSDTHQKWQVGISSKGIRKYLGSYDSYEKAVEIRKIAEMEMLK